MRLGLSLSLSLSLQRPSPASEADSRWQFDDQLNGFTITALRDIPRGSQVYDSYGRKCNSRFFVNYGFALEDNEEDNEALVRVQVTKEHPGFAVKARLAGPTRNLLNIRGQLRQVCRQMPDVVCAIG